MFFGKADIQKTKKEIEKVKDEIKEQESRRQILKSLDDKKTEVETISKRIKDISSRLPQNENTTDFYAALVDIFKETGLEYQSISPLKKIERTLYTEIPYEIKLKATYHELGQFLNLIEENPKRIMRVINLNITNDPLVPTIHPVTLKVSTFIIKKQSETETTTKTKKEGKAKAKSTKDEEVL